jgi:ADP-ribose pyrophosphatase
MEDTKYQGQFIRVTEERIDDVTWERVYLNDGVQVFPITEDGKIIMIEERRPHEKHPIRLKFVTGLMEKGEDSLLTANREMQEEIGFKADHLQILIERNATGTINNNFYQIVATGLSKSKIPNPDGEDTIVSINEYSVPEIEKMLEDGDLPWSMGALGIFKIKMLLEKNLLNLKTNCDS